MFMLTAILCRELLTYVPMLFIFHLKSHNKVQLFEEVIAIAQYLYQHKGGYPITHKVWLWLRC